MGNLISSSSNSSKGQTDHWSIWALLESPSLGGLMASFKCFVLLPLLLSLQSCSLISDPWEAWEAHFRQRAALEWKERWEAEHSEESMFVKWIGKRQWKSEDPHTVSANTVCINLQCAFQPPFNYSFLPTCQTPSPPSHCMLRLFSPHSSFVWEPHELSVYL